MKRKALRLSKCWPGIGLVIFSWIVATIPWLEAAELVTPPSLAAPPRLGYWSLESIEAVPVSKPEKRNPRDVFELEHREGYLGFTREQYDRNGLEMAAEGYCSWTRPPEAARPGDSWDGKFDAVIKKASSRYEAKYGPPPVTAQIKVKIKGTSQIPVEPGADYRDSGSGILVRNQPDKAAEAARKTTFEFPEPDKSEYFFGAKPYMVVEVEAGFAAGETVSNVYRYYYRWKEKPDGPPAGKPLCQEAFQHFGKEVTTGYEWLAGTHIRRDLSDLKTDFNNGIDCYKKRAPGRQIYTSLPVQAANVEVGNWLFGYGGAGKRELIDRFSFTPEKLTDAIGDAQQTKELQQGHFTAPPRSEAALYQAIVRAYHDPRFKSQQPLSPGDVLCLALEQTDGDLRFATLLAHNTLRALARKNKGDNLACGLNGDPDAEIFTKYLETIRGGEVPGLDPKTDSLAGDNSGAWYHMFGTAFYELQTRAGEAPFTNPLPDEILEAMREAAKTDATDRTYWSDFAQRGEQIYRKWWDGQVSDPEKWCFELWGAQIASQLFKELAERKQLRAGGAGPNEDVISGTGRVLISPDDPNLADKVKQVILQSPFQAEQPDQGTPKDFSVTPEELKTAFDAYQGAFDEYTRLATEGGEGDIEKARAEYKSAYERYQGLERRSKH